MGNTKNRSILRKLPLFIGLAGGIGGIFPDLEHVYKFLLNPQYTSYYLHYSGWLLVLILGIGSLLTFSSRHIATLVLTWVNALSHQHVAPRSSVHSIENL